MVSRRLDYRVPRVGPRCGAPIDGQSGITCADIGCPATAHVGCPCLDAGSDLVEACQVGGVDEEGARHGHVLCGTGTGGVSSSWSGGASGSDIDRPYPVGLEVDYVERCSRLTVLFRLPLTLPLALVSVCLHLGAAPAAAAAVLVSGSVPAPILDFQRAVWRWQSSVAAYALLLTDQRPRLTPGFASPAVESSIGSPDDVARRKVIVWKFVTALPHLFVLVALTFVLLFTTAFTWIAAVVTGRTPRRTHDFGVGVVRWYGRVAAYLQSLTDSYPPFSLRSTAGPARRNVAELASVAGLVPACFVAAFATYIIGFTGTHDTQRVSFAALSASSVPPDGAVGTVESGKMVLSRPVSNDDETLGLTGPPNDLHLVAFTITITNTRGIGEPVPVSAHRFHLTDDAGTVHDAALVSVDGVIGDGEVGHDGPSDSTIVFQVPGSGPPQRLRWDVLDYISVPRRGETIEWIFDP